MKKHDRLFNSAADLAARGMLREACDKYLQATFACPSVWHKNRFYCFIMHSMILRELHFPATPQDIKTLKKQFLDNEEEPSHFRVEAAFAVGVLESERGRREDAAEVYRQGLDIASSCTAEERGRIGVVSDSGPTKVSQLIDTVVKSVESNLSILEGRGRTQPLNSTTERRQLGDQSAMPGVGVMKMSFDSMLEMDEDLVERATTVGGNACDCCGKTLEELGQSKFDCCSRCKLVYYCSKACQVSRRNSEFVLLACTTVTCVHLMSHSCSTSHQKSAWKSGHKGACRKPDEIHPGDYMIVKDVQARPELNGSVVKVLNHREEDRWVVQSSGTADPVSLSAKKLQHIRPAK